MAQILIGLLILTVDYFMLNAVLYLPGLLHWVGAPFAISVFRLMYLAAYSMKHKIVNKKLVFIYGTNIDLVVMAYLMLRK